MKESPSPLLKLLYSITSAGNVLFLPWILYNCINAGFQGTNIEKVPYIALMG